MAIRSAGSGSENVHARLLGETLGISLLQLVQGAEQPVDDTYESNIQGLCALSLLSEFFHAA
jgi:hypothetical protein